MVKARKQAEYHWDKGDVSWSPAPPPKKKKEPKTESLIERLKRQKKEKEALIDMM
jgi:hypothetical protein